MQTFGTAHSGYQDGSGLMLVACPRENIKKVPLPPVGDARKLGNAACTAILRMEANGLLKSWAVLKGPSPDPRNKSPAIQT